MAVFISAFDAKIVSADELKASCAVILVETDELNEPVNAAISNDIEDELASALHCPA